MPHDKPKLIQAHIPMDHEFRRKAGIAAAAAGMSFAGWVRVLIRREITRDKKEK